jgi:hypothetical protein
MKKVTFPLRVRDRAFSFAASVCGKKGLKAPRGFDPVKMVVSIERKVSGESEYEKSFRSAVWQYLAENLGHGNLPENLRREVLGNPVKIPRQSDTRLYASIVGSLSNLLSDRAFGIDRAAQPDAYKKLVVIQGKGTEELARAFRNQYVALAAKAVSVAVVNWIMKLRLEELMMLCEVAGLPVETSSDWKNIEKLSEINLMRQKVSDHIVGAVTQKLSKTGITGFTGEQRDLF